MGRGRVRISRYEKLSCTCKGEYCLEDDRIVEADLLYHEAVLSAHRKAKESQPHTPMSTKNGKSSKWHENPTVSANVSTSRLLNLKDDGHTPDIDQTSQYPPEGPCFDGSIEKG